MMLAKSWQCTSKYRHTPENCEIIDCYIDVLVATWNILQLSNELVSNTIVHITAVLYNVQLLLD